MPCSEFFEEAEQGKVKLGGCVIIDGCPEYSCKDCNHEWNKQQVIDNVYGKIISVEASIGGFFGPNYGVSLDLKNSQIIWNGTAAEWETKFVTTVHELGHLYFRHLGTPYEKWWSYRSHLNINEVEFETESVCWLVCEIMGIKNPSAEYLNGYTENNDEIPRISIDAVLKSVGIIESLMQTTKEPRKEIITTVIELKNALDTLE